MIAKDFNGFGVLNRYKKGVVYSKDMQKTKIHFAAAFIIAATFFLIGLGTVEAAISPTIYITAPVNNTKTNDNTPSIFFYFTDPEAGNGSATLYFNATNVSYNGTVFNNTNTSLTASTLSDGNWTFWVNVTDFFGDTNKSWMYDILIDTTPPIITFVNPTDSNISAQRDWFYINTTLNEEGQSANAEINGSNYSMAQGTTNLEWFINRSGLSEGNYTWRIFVNDTLLNNGKTGFAWTNITVVFDNDGDGFNSSIDCNDNNATVRPLLNNSENNISSNILVCSGIYIAKIYLGNNNIYLDGNGSTIGGNNSTAGPWPNGITVHPYNSIEIRNFNIQNYSGNGIISDITPGTSNTNIINNNISHISGAAINLTTTINFTIKNNNIFSSKFGILLDSANFTTIKNTVFESSIEEYGIALINSAGFNTIENNSINAGSIGIDLAYLTGYNSISYNNITSSSIYAIIITGSVYNNITFNNIYGNNWDGIFFDTSGADPSSNNVSYNNIYSNSNYEINNQQTANITAEFNWWGTTDCSAINASIYDYYDNSSLGIVDWAPFLNDSYPNGVPSPCPSPPPNTPPTINITAPPNNTKTNDNTPLITFYFTDPENTTAESRLYNSYCQFSTNNTTTQNNTYTNLESNSDPNCLGGIPDGNWSFWVNVTDYITENKSELLYLIIDTIPPGVFYDTGTDQNGTYSKNWIFINGTATDPTPSIGLVLEFNGANESWDNCQTTDGTWVNCWKNKTGLADGTYLFKVYAHDGAGNENTTEIRIVTLDTTPPSNIPWINDTSNGTNWIYWEWPQDATLGFSHYEIWLNNTFRENKSTSNYNATGLSANTGYEIQVRPVDDVGNIGNWTNDTGFTKASTGGGGNNNDGGGGNNGGGGVSTNLTNKTNPQARVPGVSQAINRTVQTPSSLIINLSKEFSARGLRVGDVIQVEIAKEPHTITIDKINAKNKTVTLIIRSTPTEVNLKESGSVLVDVDGDGKYDIKIIIDRVDGEKTTVILQDLKVEREQTPTAFLTLTQGQVGILGAIIGAAMFSILVYFYVRKREMVKR